MRAAVLELAFRGLGAQVARSGAIEGNLGVATASPRSSATSVVGSGTGRAPRRQRSEHTDVELRREDWQPPFEVEIEGLGTCLPLFGVSPV